MLLSSLLDAAGIKNKLDFDPEISGITIDTRQVESGFMFVAIKGAHTDGHQYIRQAIESGTVVIVGEYLPEGLTEIQFIQVENSADAAGKIASAFFGNPSRHMKVIGVTGTNGKTTVATLLYEVLRLMGHRTGLISTVENRIEEQIIPATHTTPDPVTLQSLLADMLAAGCEYVFMEVSSHALEQDRTSGLMFAGGIFTNLTHDHLDYHGNFMNYLKAKKKFFDQLDKSAFALVNGDDKNGLVMLQNTAAKKFTFSLKRQADFKGKIIENNLDGLLMELNRREVNLRLAGEFNASNITAVYGAAMLLELDELSVLKALSLVTPPKGRMDTLLDMNRQITFIIDYAHTPDALENVLTTLVKINSHKGKIITVIGCGGERDRDKRPVMGLKAAALSDEAIFTSDNPRSENPDTILSEMMKGVPLELRRKVLIVSDRKQAIHTASKLARRGDIVLIAGKGHENYQLVNGKKLEFDDRKIVEDIFSLSK